MPDAIVIKVNERVMMRAICPSESAQLVSLIQRNIKRLRDYITLPNDLSEMVKVLNEAEQAMKHSFGLYMGIYVESTLSGQIRIERVTGKATDLSVAYWLCSEQTGQGLTRHCLKCLIEYALVFWSKIDEIVADVKYDNISSQNVLRDLGFIPDKEWLPWRSLEEAVFVAGDGRPPKVSVKWRLKGSPLSPAANISKRTEPLGPALALKPLYVILAEIKDLRKEIGAPVSSTESTDITNFQGLWSCESKYMLIIGDNAATGRMQEISRKFPGPIGRRSINGHLIKDITFEQICFESGMVWKRLCECSSSKESEMDGFWETPGGSCVGIKGEYCIIGKYEKISKIDGNWRIGKSTLSTNNQYMHVTDPTGHVEWHRVISHDTQSIDYNNIIQTQISLEMLLLAKRLFIEKNIVQGEASVLFDALQRQRTRIG